MTLIEFLTARLAEDGQAAQDAAEETSKFLSSWDAAQGGGAVWRSEGGGIYTASASHPFATDPYGGGLGTTGVHIARHDPARVLREVAAKRRMLDEVVSLIDGLDADLELTKGTQGWTSTGESDLLFKILALPYADHEDYRPEWAV